jgi:hypothetical protein
VNSKFIFSGSVTIDKVIDWSIAWMLEQVGCRLTHCLMHHAQK